jgi:hypothetical protein
MMQPAQKLVNDQEQAEAQTLALLEHGAVILFLVGLALAGFALPFL